MRRAVKQDNPNNFCYKHRLNSAGLLHLPYLEGNKSQELNRNTAKFKFSLAPGVFSNFLNFLLLQWSRSCIAQLFAYPEANSFFNLATTF